MHPKVLSSEIASWEGNRLLRLFPGRIIWLSYPHLNLEPAKGEHTNEMIDRVNNLNQEGISRPNSSRLRFLNLTPFLASFHGLYVDVIHHPGKLSKMVLDKIMDVLNSMS